MENVKNLILQYFDKAVVLLAIAVISYSAFRFYTNFKEEDSIKKIKEYSPVVELNFRTGKPPEPAKVDYTERVNDLFSDIPVSESVAYKAFNLQRTDKIQKTNGVSYAYESESNPTDTFQGETRPQQEFSPGDTEILYRGGTPDKALIAIRKTAQNGVIEQSFITRRGEKIGANEPVNGIKQIDFMTGCTLLEINTNAKKQLSTNKMSVNLSENGEFINTSFNPEPYFITTVKIKYKNERLLGEIQNLWLGATSNIGTVTYLLEQQAALNKPADVEPDTFSKKILGEFGKRIRELLPESFDKTRLEPNQTDTVNVPPGVSDQGSASGGEDLSKSSE